MARGTTISSVNVIAGLAGEQCVVMTTDARANNMCMIHIRCRHRYPDVGAVVAGLAGVGGIYMIGVFPGGVEAVMTFVTGLPLHIGMIEGNRRPTTDSMAGTAVNQCGYVVRWLTGGDIAVVAIHAWAHHFIMINKICWNPAINIVAGLTQLRGGYMTYRFTGSGHIVMARDTGLATNQRMIHGGRPRRGFKTKRGMANLAGVGNRNVSGCYTHREYAIVALVALLG